MNHNAMTQSGHSGSPILMPNAEGKYCVAGIHTHKGLDYRTNSGIYFNASMLATLKQYVKELNSENQLSEVVCFEGEKS